MRRPAAAEDNCHGLRSGDLFEVLIEEAEDYDLRGVVIDGHALSAQPTTAHNSI